MKRFLMFSGAVALVVAASTVYLVATEEGSRWLVTFVAHRLLGPSRVSIDRVEGTWLKDLAIHDLRLPEKRLTIQSVTGDLFSTWSFHGVEWIDPAGTVLSIQRWDTPFPPSIDRILAVLPSINE